MTYTTDLKPYSTTNNLSAQTKFEIFCALLTKVTFCTYSRFIHQKTVINLVSISIRLSFVHCSRRNECIAYEETFYLVILYV